MSTISKYVEGKVVLVTGAAGTVGSALTRQLAPYTRQVRAFDHAETGLFFLDEEMRGIGHVSPQLGDVRDLERLRFAMMGVDVVFHAAALKHVGIGEYNPFEVVQTNLVGLNNVMRAALDSNVERVIFTSSDKAVSPTNTMGASKLMGERLMTAANEIRGHRRTIFASVRFGNVIGSRGSVIPVFAQQVQRHLPITLTDEAMTRYIMTVDESARLVLEAGSLAHGGEVFVTKMHALRIIDLAEAVARQLGSPGHPVTRVGLRTGEKLYEELLSVEEVSRAVETDRLLVVLPPAGSRYPGLPTRTSYPEARSVERMWNSSSETPMTTEEIERYLGQHRILAEFRSSNQFAEVSIG